MKAYFTFNLFFCLLVSCLKRILCTITNDNTISYDNYKEIKNISNVQLENNISNFKDCLNNQNLKNLQIIVNTYNYDEDNTYNDLNFDGENFEIDVFQNCSLNSQFELNNDFKTYKKIKPIEKIYETYKIDTRQFRIKSNNYTIDSFNIDKIEVNFYDKNFEIEKNVYRNTKVVKINTEDSFDFFINYDCDENKISLSSWFIVKISIEIQNIMQLNISYIKLCDPKSFDYSILIKLYIILQLLYFAKETTLEVHPNFINLTLDGYIFMNRVSQSYTYLTLFILIYLFFMIIGFTDYFLELITLCIGVLSVSLIIDSIITYVYYLYYKETINENELNAVKVNFSYFSISLRFLVCLSLGFICYLHWIMSNSTLFYNIIAGTISIISIRLLIIYSIRTLGVFTIIIYIYNIIWIWHYSHIYNVDYAISYKENLNLPIRFYIPSLLDTPIKNYISFPISDIVLPGIALMYLEIFDKCELVENKYYSIGLSSVLFGLIFQILVRQYIIKNYIPSVIYTLFFIFFFVFLTLWRRGYIEIFLNGMYQSKQKNSLLVDRLDDKIRFGLKDREIEMKIISKETMPGYQSKSSLRNLNTSSYS